MSRNRFVSLLVPAAVLLSAPGSSARAAELPRFVVTYPAERSSSPLDGRLLLFFSTDKSEEPHYSGEVDYGPRADHCWNGDHTRANATSRLRYHQMFAPKIVERITRSAPPGADLSSWRY